MRYTERDDEAGNMTISMIVVVPMLILIGGLLVMGGYLAGASGAVQSAANEAARAASMARGAGTAADNARSTATSTLANSDTSCSSTSVEVDTSEFSQPLGTPGEVRVTVTCRVPLASLGLPGVPGDRTVSAEASSVIDAYRARS